jgi:transposase-like protein
MARARSLEEFQEAFRDEARCVTFLFERRWPDGFVCQVCGAGRAAALKSRAHTYECLDCGRQTSITAGTAMHRSKLPLTTWFWAAHLMATHSNGMSARQLEDQLGLSYKTAWLLTQKLRRSMVDPNREPLEGVVEVDQTEIPFRAGDAFFDPCESGKILIAGAVEVIDRDANQAKPRRKHAKYLDARSGRIRLAMIADNSAASIEAFVRANVRRGTTLLTDGHASFPGLSGDYRHDPRVVGKMAAHVVLPWIHRVFALMKRWSLGTYHGLRRSTSTRISKNSSSATTAAFIGTSRLKPCSALPQVINR